MKNYRNGGQAGTQPPRDFWKTPPEFYDGLDQEFGFALDAACLRENCLAAAGICADEGGNALTDPWRPGPVWCNPPYSDMATWTSRGRLMGRAEVVVMLIPCDTSTRWWMTNVAAFAAEVLFVAGRLRFVLPDGKTNETKKGGGGFTVPSAVVVYRPGEDGPPTYGYVDRAGRRLNLDDDRQAVLPMFEGKTR